MEEVKEEEEVKVSGAPPGVVGTGGADEDALLQQALAMSVDPGGGEGEPDPSFYETMTAGVTDEDEAMQLALAMR